MKKVRTLLNSPKVLTLLLLLALSVITILDLQRQQNLRQFAQTPAPQPQQPQGTQLFVAPTGNGDCSQASPCTMAAANTKATPGTTILVAPGTYNGTFTTTKGGAAGNFITFKSQTKHGATFTGTAGDRNENGVNLNHEYVRFQDFTVTGADIRDGIEIGASNVEVIGNHIHHITQFKTGGTGFQGGAGVDMGATTASNILIDGNLIHDVGAPGSTEQLIHGMYLASHVTNGRVTNNVIYKVEDFGLHPYDETEASGWHFINNTIANTGRGILQAPNGVTRNNIVFNTRGASYDIRGAGNVVSNNIAGGTGGAPAGASNGVQTGVDPMFVNAAGDDYHIKPGSPAIDKGLADGAPQNDFDGKTRPQGAGIDLGAFETGGAAGGSPVPSGSGVAPSFYPLAPCPTCVNPSVQPLPSGGQSPTSGAVIPSSTMASPAPSMDPCESESASLAHDKKKKKSKHKDKEGGVSKGIEVLFQFLIELLNLILKLLGGGEINQPVQPTPEEPSESEPSTAPEPSDPCDPSEE